MLTALLLLAVLASPDAAQERLAAAKPTAPTPAVAEFERYLTGLGHRTITAVTPARAALEERISKASPREAEDLLRLFWRWHERVCEAHMKAFLERRDLQEALLSIQAAIEHGVWTRPLDEIAAAPEATRARVRRASPKAFRELDGFREAGFDFAYGEGTWYLVSDARFLARVATSLPDGDLKAYATFRAHEDGETVAHDAGLMVSWDGLRRRLARWEAFRMAHPELPEAKGPIDREIRSLAHWYFFGLDNTPAYGHDMKRLDPELQATYRRFLAEDTTSAYHPALSAAWAVLQKSGFRPTSELVAALRRHLVHEAFRSSLDFLEQRIQGRRP